MKLAGGWYSAARRGVGAALPFPYDPVSRAISSAKLTAGAETGAGAGARPRGRGRGAATGAAAATGSGVIAWTIGFFFVKYSPS
jgi:hypothetical protein